MKAYIWTLPTRIFHTSLVILTLIAFLSADDDFLKLHSIVGYGIGVLIIFRIFWGLTGPKYSNFKDFNFSIKKAFEFIKNQLLFKKDKIYAGHNPAASLVLFIIIILMGLVVFSGMLNLGEEANKGYFKFLNTSIFEDIHEFLANFILFFIFLHISGVLIHHLLHKKDNTLKSILYGYKNLEAQNVNLTIKQKLLSFFFFLLFFEIIYLAYSGLDHLY